MWITLLALGWGSVAAGGDDPGLWWRQNGAIAYKPTGLLSDTAVEYRAPVMRYGGAVFNDTFVGVGGRVTATPAFVEGAARVSFQLIDVLPVTVEAVHTQYWRSSFGLISFPKSDLSGGTDDEVRDPRYANGEGTGGHMWSVLVSPTLQMKVGPIVGFSSWGITWMRIVPSSPQSDPWIYEPYRGMVVGFQDTTYDHTSAVLYEAMDGEEQALLRLGALQRGRWSAVTPDRSLSVGGVVQWKPGTKASVPSFLAVVAPYLDDPDYIGPVPFMALLATWEGGGP